MWSSLSEAVDGSIRAAFNGFAWVFHRTIRVLVRSDRFYRNVYHRLVNRLSRAFSPRVESRVQTDDWKYLIVLDACRFDAFQQCSTLPGDLQKANSYSGWTKEWAISNFSRGDWSDVVYISASPWPSMLEKWIGEGTFFEVEDVWEYGWDEETGGCPPDAVRKAAISRIAEHPDRRAIIHFQQPHKPFMGEDRLNLEDNVGPYHALRRREVEKSEVWEAYLSNLESALTELDALLPALDGRIVVTSDHGECFGEFNLFGHPGALVPAITKVPWLVLEGKRTVDLDKISQDRSATGSLDTEKLRTERLRDLGYLQ